MIDEVSNLRMNTIDAATYLGVSASYLEKRRLDGEGPAYLKIGSRVVYERKCLDDYAESRRRYNTSQK